MHFSPSCFLSSHIFFLSALSRSCWPWAETPRQLFPSDYCLQQPPLPVKDSGCHGFGFKLKAGWWRCVLTQLREVKHPQALTYFPSLFPPLLPPCFLLTVLLVVEFGSQSGLCQLLLEGVVHLLALFGSKVILPVPHLACSGTQNTMQLNFRFSWKTEVQHLKRVRHQTQDAVLSCHLSKQSLMRRLI